MSYVLSPQVLLDQMIRSAMSGIWPVTKHLFFYILALYCWACGIYNSWCNTTNNHVKKW